MAYISGGKRTIDKLVIKVDSTVVDPSCARFIYKSNSLQSEHTYELKIVKNLADSEVLEYACFKPCNEPTEKQIRDWLFWLGHIVSRHSDPEDCKDDCWVMNNIESLVENEVEIVFYGKCSLWGE